MKYVSATQIFNLKLMKPLVLLRISVSLLSLLTLVCISVAAQATGKFLFADQFGRLWVVNADGSGQTMLTAGETVIDRNPVFSPDGSKIAFDRTILGLTNIYIMNANGSNPVAITSGGPLPNNVLNADPTWSPDGTKVAFVSDRDGTRRKEIWVINVDGTGLTKITTNVQLGTDSGGPYYGWDVEPAWSPDGTVIAFSSTRDSLLGGELYLVSPNGTNLTRLVLAGSDDRSPSWSPDSQRIAFDLGGGPLNGINLINRNGTNVVHVTNAGTWPQWSPDGTKIALLVPPIGGENPGIFTAAIDGSNLVRITNTSFEIFQHSWGAPSSTPIPTRTISGNVVGVGGVPINGAILTLSGTLTRTVQSDAAGHYSFTGLPVGDYTVTITKTGFGFTPPAIQFSNLTSDQEANFTAYPAFSISGRVNDLTHNIVVVNLTGTQSRTTNTDVNGFYSFEILPVGNYTVTPTSPYFNFSPSNTTFANLSANQMADFNATRAAYTITGEVTRAGTPFSGVTLSLNGIGTSTGPTTVSDANGKYAFTNVVAGGNYYLTAFKGANYIFQPPGHSFDLLNGNKIADFSAFSANHLLFTSASYTTEEGSCSFQVTVVRGGNATGVGPITVNYTTADGTAMAGVDYVPVSGTLIFPEGTNSRTVLIPILADQLSESNETFTIALSNPTGEVDLATPSTATVTITNAAPQPPVTPILVTDGSTDLALALNATNMVAGDFDLTTQQNFSNDQRTRVSLFIEGASACEQASEYSVEAQDAQMNRFALPLEAVLKLPGSNPYAHLIVRLSENLPAGELFVTVKVRGLSSNRARLIIGP